jgi:hypothetical protein
VRTDGARTNEICSTAASPSSADGGSSSRSVRICDVGSIKPCSAFAASRTSSGVGRAPKRSSSRSTRFTCACASGVSSHTQRTATPCGAAASST